MKKEKICVICNDPFSDYLLNRGKEIIEKYFNPLLKFETHIISFEDCYKYQTRKIGTLIIHPFCEKQFKKTWFYPWRFIRVLSRISLRILNIIRIIKIEKIQLVRGYGISNLSFIGLIACGITKKPYIISLHSDYDYMFKLKGKIKGIMWHFIEKLTIKFSDFVIVVSPFLIEYAKKHGNKKVIYIPNPLGLEKFIEVEKKRTFNEKEEKILIFAGRFFDPAKNFYRLLVAYSKIKPELREKSKLFVLGDDGGKLGYYKELTKKLGIEKNVEFIGRVPRTEMPLWYMKSDFLLLPSLYEALPNVLIEGMATGLPVLTSKHPSCTYLADRTNGIIVDPVDIQEIKEGIEKLLSMKQEEYKEKAENSVKKIKNFNDEEVFKKVAFLYEKLIKR